MKKNSETKTRIVEAAIKLFYENGYSETGINEILEKSSSFKKSLYTHFSSKTELGICYIKQVEGDLSNLLTDLLNRHPNFEKFIKIWLRIVRSNFSKNFPRGCPLANMPINSTELSLEVKKSFENLKVPFTQYFTTNYSFSFSKAYQISEEILFLYEGAMTSYKMDPNRKYFDYLEKHLNYIAEQLKVDNY